MCNIENLMDKEIEEENCVLTETMQIRNLEEINYKLQEENKIKDKKILELEKHIKHIKSTVDYITKSINYDNL